MLTTKSIIGKISETASVIKNTESAAKYLPKTIEETLTGAVMAALGEEYAGLFSNNDALVNEIKEAGNSVNEAVWHLPMNKAYDKMIDSDIADMKNIGGRLAGGSTAACFLARFIKEGVTWAHLDIAGVDKYEKSRPTTPKGATGWGVRLLNQLVK